MITHKNIRMIRDVKSCDDMYVTPLLKSRNDMYVTPLLKSRDDIYVTPLLKSRDDMYVTPLLNPIVPVCLQLHLKIEVGI